MCKELISATLAGAGCDRCAVRSGRDRAAFAAGYFPPELVVAECVVQSGFAASGGADPMVEDPWEDL